MPADAQQIDSRIQIVTPENIAFQYRLAGPFRRLPAYALDCALQAAAIGLVVAASTIAFTFLNQMGVGVGGGLIFWFLTTWFYGGLFETFWNGQTPGKRIMGIRVLTVEGQPIDALQAILRNVLRFADLFPLLPLLTNPDSLPFFPSCLTGLCSMTLTRRFQRLGDLACGTMVVVEERDRHRGVLAMNDRAAVQLATLLPANLAVSPSLARALSMYVERRRLIGPARRAEIARVLADPLYVMCRLEGPIDPDLLLSALYYREFVADRVDAEASTPPPPDTSPAPRQLVGGLKA